MYVRLVESEFLYSQHKLLPERIPGGLKVPPTWGACAGHASVWDLHVEEIPRPNKMRTLSDSIKIMKLVELLAVTTLFCGILCNDRGESRV